MPKPRARKEIKHVVTWPLIRLRGFRTHRGQTKKRPSAKRRSQRSRNCGPEMKAGADVRPHDAARAQMVHDTWERRLHLCASNMADLVTGDALTSGGRMRVDHWRAVHSTYGRIVEAAIRGLCLTGLCQSGDRLRGPVLDTLDWLPRGIRSLRVQRRLPAPQWN